MRIANTFDKVILTIFFLFSCWLMWKSFSYAPKIHEFVLARNVVGDFGLHLSLIRSVSWGNNIPVESPFYPGVPMPYHWAVDVLAGLLERAGVRIDIAYNGISAIAFTALLYVIYLMPQRIFGKNRFMGIVSVLLFVLHSSLTFVDFFAGKHMSFSLLKDIWGIPNYIHAGPFDGSQISIFFTPNVFTNQRHLVAGLAIGLWLIYWLWPLVTGKKRQSTSRFVWHGILLGVLGWVHTLLFLGTSVVIGLLCFMGKKWRFLPLLFLPAAVVFAPRAWIIFHVGLVTYPLWNLGFLAPKPLTWLSFFTYWWVNFGFAVIAIPVGVFLAGRARRQLFWAALSLFVIANTFQLSYRIDHNHSILNLFVIIGNVYIAYALCYMWRKGNIWRIIVTVCTLLLIISGFLDLMAVKNDYQLHVADAPKNKFMQWVRKSTPRDAVFLSKPEILDPVTLAGRKNYLGHDYYLSVMGYDYGARLRLAEKYFTATDSGTVEEIKKQGITYIVLLKGNARQSLAAPVYQDDAIVVYKL